MKVIERVLVKRLHGIVTVTQKDTTVLNPVMSQETEGGKVHLNIVTVLLS